MNTKDAKGTKHHEDFFFCGDLRDRQYIGEKELLVPFVSFASFVFMEVGQLHGARRTRVHAPSDWRV
jgi:hypothetical protein